jgi:hypothetical protein
MAFKAGKIKVKTSLRRREKQSHFEKPSTKPFVSSPAVGKWKNAQE